MLATIRGAMSSSLALFGTLLLVVSCIVVVDAAEVSEGGFKLIWEPVAGQDTVKITISCDACTGYVSLAWSDQDDSAHLNMDTIYGHYNGGVPAGYACYQLAGTSEPPAKNSPVSTPPFFESGTDSGGGRTFVFNVPRVASNPQEGHDLQKQRTLWYAYDDGDDWSQRHNTRASFENKIDLTSGEAPAPTPEVSLSASECAQKGTFCDGKLMLKYRDLGTEGEFTLTAYNTDAGKAIAVAFFAPGGGFHNNMEGISIEIGAKDNAVRQYYTSGGSTDPPNNQVTSLNHYEVISSESLDGTSTVVFKREKAAGTPANDVEVDIDGPIGFSWAIMPQFDGTRAHRSSERGTAGALGNCDLDEWTGCTPQKESKMNAGLFMIMVAGSFVGLFALIRHSKHCLKWCISLGGGGGGGGGGNYHSHHQFQNGGQPAYASNGSPSGNVMTRTGKEKKSGGGLSSLWQAFMMYRLPYSHIALVNVLLGSAFLLLNIGALYVSDIDPATKPNFFANQWGYLAGAGTVFVTLPATRNSVLRWTMGLAFDRVIIYHRWLGRWVVFTVTMHMVLYYRLWQKAGAKLQDKMIDVDYVFYGFLSWVVGVFVVLTATEWFRRNHFEFFYWCHMTFFGFYILGAMHVPQMVIYVAASGAFYGLDLLVRSFWGAYITRTVELQYKDGNIVKVSCKKHPVANMLNLWQVGQYIFINIPAISVLEWHPFSVSSGPREQTVEVHIRGLGDHSDALVEMSKTATSLYCRVDGPYGYHKLNYRRYPVLLMVGGGVGITPVIGIVKDLYNVGDLSPHDRATVPPHCIEGIYVVWVMTEETVYGWFCQELMACYSQANKAGSPFPPLYVWIYVTRAKTVSNTDLFVPGRPDFEAVFNTINADHPQKSTVVFACGPAPMVNACWDRSVDRQSQGQRFDFHHETFDF